MVGGGVGVGGEEKRRYWSKCITYGDGGGGGGVGSGG